MMRRLNALAAATTCLGGAVAAIASPYRPLPNENAGRTAMERAPVTGLPFSRGRSFATLDEYLAFRKKGGAIDLPWYKEIEPGIYELQTSTRPGPTATRLTRAELASKFGFDH